jgi:hypothetical protein|tara:strand:+ start:1623 stop:2456 length:834 start_codon:yes stop_codon:yes gene_type:complete
MKKLILPILIFAFFSCNSESKVEEKKENETDKISTDKVRVLNFGSVHLSGSSDAHSSISDVSNPNVKADIKKIVDRLLKFNPTIICVEIPPESTDFINETYQKYKIDQSKRINYSEEVNVIGLEVARLSGTKKIYGIDNPIGFDYPSLIEMANKNSSDSLYVQNIMDSYATVNKKPLLEQFTEINTTKYKMETFDFYNFLATMHNPNNFEGSDIIADFYKRNLRMYTNFSDIPLTKNDRVLIIMGATHTAYFDIFIGNNPKYILENLDEYTSFTEKN